MKNVTPLPLKKQVIRHIPANHYKTAMVPRTVLVGNMVATIFVTSAATMQVVVTGGPTEQNSTCPRATLGYLSLRVTSGATVLEAGQIPVQRHERP